MSNDAPTENEVRFLNSALAYEIERLRAALGQIAGKNNLEGVAPDAAPSAAYAALHECELIARDALR